MIASGPGEPTLDEVRRVLMRMHASGTVKRLDALHEALMAAYRTGRRDGERDCARRHGHEA